MVDVATRRQLFVQRFADGEADKAIAILERLRDKILTRLNEEPTEFQYGRLSALLRDIQGMMGREFSDFRDEVRAGVTEFGLAESEFLAETATSVATVPFAVPSVGQIQQAVAMTPMVDGLRMDQTLSAFAGAKAREIIGEINSGILAGDTTPQIAKKITELANNKQRRDATAIVRTVTNHVSSQARDLTARENAGVLDGLKWVATLDSRTTLICAGRDGNVYPVDSGPRPPAHWQCRSTMAPVIKKSLQIPGIQVGATRPSVGADGAELQDARRTYSGWLRDQPAAFQDEVLGRSRGKLFRAGRVQIDRFRDETGRTYTLGQLRSLDPIAWQRAGLNDVGV